ncbi:MAG: DMT family transporter [Gaiellaceae bacterium]
MTRAYWPMLFVLASVWGASYLFIKVAVEDIEPAPMMFFRLALAALLLLPLVAAQGKLGEVRRAWRAGLILGVVNGAIPFTLIAWGEKHIDSGVAAIANATVPLFVALLLIQFLPTERLSRARLAGVLLGLVGVAVLTGGQPAAGGWWAVAGTLAVVVASLSYGIAGVYGQVRVQGTAGPVLATASMIGGALALLPIAVWQLPDEVPSGKAIGSLLAMTVLGTAFAQLILFRMLRLHGSARLSLVTYLMPPVALFYGALLLDEAIRPEAVAGLALILVGVAVGSGKMRRRPQHA